MPSSSAGEMVKKHPGAVAFVVILLVIAAPFWRLTLMKGVLVSDDGFTSDLMNESLPQRAVIGQAFRQGELPLWEPHVYGGIPVMAWPGAGVFYPPSVALFGVFPPHIALNCSVLLTLLIAAAGAYFLLRILNCGMVAALFGATAFAYSGFMIFHLRHLGMVSSACWLPWGTLLIERSFRGPGGSARSVMWLAPILALQWLAGHGQIAYFSVLFYAMYFFCRWCSTWQESSRVHRIGGLSWFVISIAAGIAMAAIQVLPTYELTSLSQRSSGVSLTYATAFSYDPENVKMFVYPYANGDFGNQTYHGSGVFWEDYGYVGVIPLALALSAAILRWRNWHVRFFVFAALVSYILVLGRNTPAFAIAFRWIPGLSYFRFSSRFMLIVDFSLCILASISLSELFSRMRWPSAVRITLLFLTLGDLLYFQMRHNPIIEMSVWQKAPAVVEKLNPGTYRVFSPLAYRGHNLAFDEAKGWESNLQPFVEQREYLQPNTNMMYGISTPDGYLQLVPIDVVDIWGDQNRQGILARFVKVDANQLSLKPPFLKMLNLQAVRYVLSPLPVQGAGLELVDHVGKIAVYRNHSALPRAFLAGSYRIVGNRLAARALLISQDFNPAREAVLYEKPPFPSGEKMPNAQTSIVRYSYNEVILQVHSDSPGIVVLSDTFYPGWKAELDGKPAPILKTNVLMRGVAVTAGDHRLRFVYSPESFKLGVIISFVSTLIVLISLSVRRDR